MKQNKTFIIRISRKIKKTSAENKRFMSKIIFFLNFNRYIDHTFIYLHLCQDPTGRNFKKENKVAIFTFFEVFLILILPEHNLENSSKDLEFSKQKNLLLRVEHSQSLRQ